MEIIVAAIMLSIVLLIAAWWITAAITDLHLEIIHTNSELQFANHVLKSIGLNMAGVK